jgi:hypothetical protein
LLIIFDCPQHRLGPFKPSLYHSSPIPFFIPFVSSSMCKLARSRLIGGFLYTISDIDVLCGGSSHTTWHEEEMWSSSCELCVARGTDFPTAYGDASMASALRSLPALPRMICSNFRKRCRTENKTNRHRTISYTILRLYKEDGGSGASRWPAYWSAPCRTTRERKQNKGIWGSPWVWDRHGPGLWARAEPGKKSLEKYLIRCMF